MDKEGWRSSLIGRGALPVPDFDQMESRRASSGMSSEAWRTGESEDLMNQSSVGVMQVAVGSHDQCGNGVATAKSKLAAAPPPGPSFRDFLKGGPKPSKPLPPVAKQTTAAPTPGKPLPLPPTHPVTDMEQGQEHQPNSVSPALVRVHRELKENTWRASTPKSSEESRSLSLKKPPSPQEETTAVAAASSLSSSASSSRPSSTNKAPKPSGNVAMSMKKSAFPGISVHTTKSFIKGAVDQKAGTSSFPGIAVHTLPSPSDDKDGGTADKPATQASVPSEHSSYFHSISLNTTKNYLKSKMSSSSGSGGDRNSSTSSPSMHPPTRPASYTSINSSSSPSASFPPSPASSNTSPTSSSTNSGSFHALGTEEDCHTPARTTSSPDLSRFGSRGSGGGGGGGGGGEDEPSFAKKKGKTGMFKGLFRDKLAASDSDATSAFVPLTSEGSLEKYGISEEVSGQLNVRAQEYKNFFNVTMSNMLRASEIGRHHTLGLTSTIDKSLSSRYLHQGVSKKSTLNHTMRVTLEALVSDVQLFLETQAEIDKVVLVQAIERGRLTRRRLDIPKPHLVALKLRIPIWREMWKTELKYCASLHHLIHVYKKPITDLLMSEMRISSGTEVPEALKDVKSLFENLDGVLRVHVKLKNSLHAIRTDGWPFLENSGQAFLAVVPFLKLVYGAYANCYQLGLNSLLSMKRISSKLNARISDLNKYGGDSEKGSLIDLLRGPLLRLDEYCKYFEEFKASTIFTHRAEYDHICEVLTQLSEFNQVVKETIAKKERAAPLVAIKRRLLRAVDSDDDDSDDDADENEDDEFGIVTEDRSFLNEGSMFSLDVVASGKKSYPKRNLVMFMFNDSVLLCQRMSDHHAKSDVMAGVKDLKVIELVTLDDHVTVVPNQKLLGTPSAGKHFWFDLKTIFDTYTIGAKTQEECEQLISSITSQKDVWLEELRKDKVFKVSLHETLRREGRLETGVPCIVEVLAAYISRHHLKEEGVFRMSGSAKTIKELREVVDKVDLSADTIDLSKYGAHDVAGAFKQYLQELPAPLLTFELYPTLVDLQRRYIANDTPLEERIETVRDLVSENVPRPNILLVRFLLLFIQQVAFFSEENLMTQANMSIIFGPHLLRAKVNNQSAAVEMPLSNSLVEMMIKNSERVFDANADGSGTRCVMKEVKRRSIRPPETADKIESVPTTVSESSATQAAVGGKPEPVPDEKTKTSFGGLEIQLEPSLNGDDFRPRGRSRSDVGARRDSAGASSLRHTDVIVRVDEKQLNRDQHTWMSTTTLPRMCEGETSSDSHDSGGFSSPFVSAPRKGDSPSLTSSSNGLKRISLSANREGSSDGPPSPSSSWRNAKHGK